MADLSNYTWQRTNAPVSSSRTDDIWFLDAKTGWAVNSNGHILKTDDGGATWTRQFQGDHLYLRALAFNTGKDGWGGTLSPSLRLLRTTDGGAHWYPVANLPDNAPLAICGLTAPDDRTIIGAGTNFPNRRTGVIRSNDRGETWTAYDMQAHATCLIDVYFKTPLVGWVVGGKSATGGREREDIRAVVVYTEDGGETWRNVIDNLWPELPAGEWGWKICFVNDQVGYVSLESYERGAILRTTDGGLSWERLTVNDEQRNVNLEGIGFVDEVHGWVGGWGDAQFEGGYTSATDDSGNNWRNANEIGRYLNRFRFIREPQLVGYAAGDTVYKYAPRAAPPIVEPDHTVPSVIGELSSIRGSSVTVRYAVPRDARSIRIDVWDRFGEYLGAALDESVPAPGMRLIDLPCRYPEPRRRAQPDRLIVRITVDGESTSSILNVQQ